MAGQEKVHKPSDAVVEEDVVEAVAPDTSARDADVDAILDEIDDVLETNAEEFVAAFVQKGGE